MHAGMLAHALDRLATTARVLYVAAHPDDENTRLLAYFANARHVTAAYLSMTRGGGGQNLIGPEQDELLDVIRTAELLAARRLDGATQRFTRMRDFGFSKTADETLAIWDHEQALADVVWVIRTFQPDVIIARFDELPPNHGHHTASAILAREAFAAAADPARFPQQPAAGAAVWQAERLLLNIPHWREGPPPEDAVSLNVGLYDPRLGLGYGDLAARSRSQHKSQGFGVAGERGPIVERFVTVAGNPPAADVLDGVTMGWQRFGKPGTRLAAALDKARTALERDRPERALPALARAHAALAALPDVPRVRDARRALDEIIAAAAGLFVRATAPQSGVVPGGTLPVRLEVSLRRPASMTLQRVEFPYAAAAEAREEHKGERERVALVMGEKQEVSATVDVPADVAVSAPYWLAQPPGPGRHVVTEQHLVDAPEGPPPLAVDVAVGLDDRVIRLRVPVVYAWVDPVHGERTRSVLVVPPATVTPLRQAVLFPNGTAAPVALRVRAGAGEVRGEVTLDLPEGWRSVPDRLAVALAAAGEESTVHFEVTPPAGTTAIEIQPAIVVDGQSWSYREDVIDYAHIPMQVVLQPARLRLVPLALRLPKGPVGYIPGSGDSVADDLRHVGVQVDTIDDEMLRSGDLRRYRAIVVGIRAYNTRDLLRSAHARLMAYVEAGGTVVVQYTTNNRLAPLTIPIGPFPLTIGRERVTDETAAMTVIAPRSPVVLTPNPLDERDFAGWVQERGLYFAESWDPRYEPVFSAADPGEPPGRGGLLVTSHGRGHYVYTGLAFFRQLPAGVPGAYRLFANLIGLQ